MDKIQTQKTFGGRGNKSLSGYKMEYGIFFAVWRMVIDLSSNKQSKWPDLKIILVPIYEIGES